jgi:hypothetical protein
VSFLAVVAQQVGFRNRISCSPDAATAAGIRADWGTRLEPSPIGSLPVGRYPTSPPPPGFLPCCELHELVNAQPPTQS